MIPISLCCQKNMFPNIDSKSGLLSVKETLTESNFDVHRTQCIVNTLEICLTCNSKFNSKFNHQHFLQTDGTAQGPHMSCSYADIAMASVWERVRDDVFVLGEHGVASLSSFLDYTSTMDKTGKIKFTIETAGDTVLEFLDLKLKINESKIRVNFYAKSTNSFSYTTSNTCYLKNNIRDIPRGIAFRLRRICDDDETFEKFYLPKYLIASDHRPSRENKI